VGRHFSVGSECSHRHRSYKAPYTAPPPPITLDQYTLHVRIGILTKNIYNIDKNLTIFYILPELVNLNTQIRALRPPPIAALLLLSISTPRIKNVTPGRDETQSPNDNSVEKLIPTIGL
jgi:hypothetical protein